MGRVCLGVDSDGCGCLVRKTRRDGGGEGEEWDDDGSTLYTDITPRTSVLSLPLFRSSTTSPNGNYTLQ